MLMQMKGVVAVRVRYRPGDAEIDAAGCIVHSAVERSTTPSNLRSALLPLHYIGRY